MHRIRSGWIRILNLFRRSRIESDLEAQLDAHREMIKADLIGRGMDPSQAERKARATVGSDALVRELSRDEVVYRVIDDFIHDIRQGLRGLIRNRSFAIVATASLAIGIGANTFIFSLINSTLFNPLGYPDPGRLAVIWTVGAQSPGQIGTSSVSTYFSLRDQAGSFEELGGFNGGACGVRNLGADRDGAAAERIYGQCFTPSLLRILGVTPFLGRTFTDAEDQAGNVAPVVLLGYSLWQRRFGSDPAIVGREVVLNGVSTTVIGVLPSSFRLFRDPNVAAALRSPRIDFIAPLELGPTQVNSRVGGITIVGRLKRGVSLEHARSEIDAIAAGLAATDAVRHGGLGAQIDSFQTVAHRDYRSSLLLLQGAVGFVLLISCGNVAGLLLARTATRRHEVGLRAALGAGRRRIVRQLITESLPLAVLGGVLGVMLSWAGIPLFIKMAPAEFANFDTVSVDARVLIFTAIVVLATSLIFAVLPAMQAVKGALIDPLTESSRASTGGSHRQRMRSALVAGQIALALVLLIGAGLMINSFIRVVTNDLGADPSGLLTFDFHLPPGETIRPLGMYRGLGLAAVNPKPAQQVELVLEKLRNLPGVLSVAAVSTAPFSGGPIGVPLLIEGRTDLTEPPLPNSSTLPVASPQQIADYYAVTPGYFEAMRIRLINGRDFDAHDNANGRAVVIINETTARQFFLNQDPVGKRITFDFVPDDKPREIIGVVRDTISAPLQRRQTPAVYVPHLQQTTQWVAPWWGIRAGMYFVVRTQGDPDHMVPVLKAAVADVDRNTPAADMMTVSRILNDQTKNLRLYMVLLGFFAAVAALLAAIGIYGVVSYSVAERTREIGIRMALGGRASDILMMVLRQAGWIIAIGLALGLAAASFLTRFVGSLLFGISATDAATYIILSMLLLLISVVASLIPAHRASTVDPVLALKHE